MVFETETMVNMNSLVALFVLTRVTFSTGDQELATFAAGEKGFSFGEEGVFLLTAILIRGYTYVTTQLIEWNGHEVSQTTLLHVCIGGTRRPTVSVKYLFGEADVALSFLLLEDS